MTDQPSGKLYTAVTKYWPRIAAGLIATIGVIEFGERHFSWQCFLNSSKASLGAVVVVLSIKLSTGWRLEDLGTLGATEASLAGGTLVVFAALLNLARSRRIDPPLAFSERGEHLVPKQVFRTVNMSRFSERCVLWVRGGVEGEGERIRETHSHRCRLPPTFA